MRRVWFAAGLCVATAVLAGCNSSSGDGSPGDGASSQGDASSPQVKSDGRTPKQVVEGLMEAMLAHDQSKVDAMLTEKARLANALKADTPESVRYKVGDVEMIGEANAHVAAAWFYPNEDASEYRVMTMWMLRKEPEGFRVYGNIMIVPELAKYDGGKVAFDFEDPEQFAATESRVLELLAKEREASVGATMAENPEFDALPKRQ